MTPSISWRPLPSRNIVSKLGILNFELKIQELNGINLEKLKVKKQNATREIL